MNTFTTQKTQTLMAGALVMTAALTTACSDFDWDGHQIQTKEQQYANSFLEEFASETPMDTQHTWNMVQRVTGDVTAAVDGGDYVLSVYDANPINSGARLLYRTPMTSSSAQVAFDAVRTLRSVFVHVTNGTLSPVRGYYDITDGRLTTAGTKAGAMRAAATPATIGDQLLVDTYLMPRSSERTEWHIFHDEGSFEKNYWGGNKPVETIPNVYMLNGVDLTKHTDVMELGDLAQFLRSYKDAQGNVKPGCFREGENHVPLLDNRTLNPEAFCDMKSDGPISLSLVYKGTVERHNYFGYFYYPAGEEMTADKFRDLNKYVLCPYVTGSPESDGDLIQVQTHGYRFDPALGTNVPDYDNYTDWAQVDGMAMPTWLSSEYNDKFRIRGTEMQLTFFGYDGKSAPSLTFPEGCRVGFFFIKYDGQDNTAFNKIYTSYAPLNRDFINEVPTGALFRYNGYTVLGLEDQPYGDKDQNDILFLVNGSIKHEDIPDLSPDQKSATGIGESEEVVTYGDYMMAFEDLGSVGDFDFNDIVLSVSNVDENGDVLVKLLAAGGTLNTSVTFDNQVLTFRATADDEFGSTEIHDAFGVSTGVMVNTGLHSSPLVPTAKLHVGSDFSLADNRQAHRFAARIESRDGNTYTDVRVPESEGIAPQAILIGDNNWKWPSERQNIKSKYPDFCKWVCDRTFVDWSDHTWFEGYNEYVTNRVVKQSANLTVYINDCILEVGGAPATLRHTTNSNGAFVVTSKNPSVARIENNAIVPVSAGTTEVICTVRGTAEFAEVALSLTVEVTGEGSQQGGGSQSGEGNVGTGGDQPVDDGKTAFVVGQTYDLTSLANATPTVNDYNQKLHNCDLSNYKLPAEFAGTMTITIDYSSITNPTKAYSNPTFWTNWSGWVGETSTAAQQQVIVIANDKAQELMSAGTLVLAHDHYYGGDAPTLTSLKIQLNN